MGCSVNFDRLNFNTSRAHKVTMLFIFSFEIFSVPWESAYQSSWKSPQRALCSSRPTWLLPRSHSRLPFFAPPIFPLPKLKCKRGQSIWRQLRWSFRKPTRTSVHDIAFCSKPGAVPVLATITKTSSVWRSWYTTPVVLGDRFFCKTTKNTIFSPGTVWIDYVRPVGRAKWQQSPQRKDVFWEGLFLVLNAKPHMDRGQLHQNRRRGAHPAPRVPTTWSHVPDTAPVQASARIDPPRDVSANWGWWSRGVRRRAEPELRRCHRRTNSFKGERDRAWVPPLAMVRVLLVRPPTRTFPPRAPKGNRSIAAASANPQWARPEPPECFYHIWIELVGIRCRTSADTQHGARICSCHVSRPNGVLGSVSHSLRTSKQQARKTQVGSKLNVHEYTKLSPKSETDCYYNAVQVSAGTD